MPTQMSTSTLPRIAFIGAGRIARALSQALEQAGYPLSAVASRSAGSSAVLAQATGAQDFGTDIQAAADNCDVLFLTVPDDAIQTTAQALQLRPDQAAVHCSGATELGALHSLAQQGAATGGFHPLFLFAGLPDDAQKMRGCSITLEAPPALLTSLQQMVQALGCHPLTIPAGQRALYHGAANYAASFVLCIMAEATRLWAHMGIAPADAERALWPMLKGTVASAEKVGLSGALAGAISRGDVAVLERHIAALASLPPPENPDLAPLPLYQAMSARALQLARERGRPAEEVLQAMRQALQIGQ